MLVQNCFKNLIAFKTHIKTIIKENVNQTTVWNMKKKINKSKFWMQFLEGEHTTFQSHAFRNHLIVPMYFTNGRNFFCVQWIIWWDSFFTFHLIQKSLLSSTKMLYFSKVYRLLYIRFNKGHCSVLVCIANVWLYLRYVVMHCMFS